MVDVKKIEILLIEKDKTKAEWADFLGISRSTLYRKLNGESDFFREEIQKSCQFFGVEDMTSYFFVKKVTQTKRYERREIKK